MNRRNERHSFFVNDEIHIAKETLKAVKFSHEWEIPRFYYNLACNLHRKRRGSTQNVMAAKQHGASARRARCGDYLLIQPRLAVAHDIEKSNHEMLLPRLSLLDAILTTSHVKKMSHRWFCLSSGGNLFLYPLNITRCKKSLAQ